MGSWFKGESLWWRRGAPSAGHNSSQRRFFCTTNSASQRHIHGPIRYVDHRHTTSYHQSSSSRRPHTQAHPERGSQSGHIYSFTPCSQGHGRPQSHTFLDSPSGLFVRVPGSSTRGGKSRNLTTLIIQQTQNYESGAVLAPGRRTVKPRRAVSSGNESAAKRASAKLEEGDNKGALRALSSNDTLAAFSRSTFDSLSSLHPACPSNRRPPPSQPLTPALQVSPSDVRLAIMSLPNGSAGGPDGLRPQHLKDLLAVCTSEDPLLGAITDLVNLLLDGKVPDPVRPVLFGGELISCPSQAVAFVRLL